MNRYITNCFIILSAALTVIASPAAVEAGCTVSSYNDVASAVSSCTAITLGSFTVPAGQTLTMNLKAGATVSVTGTIQFAHQEWAGPLVLISGSKVTFKGAGGYFEGGGASYWDGLGDKGVKKPKFFRIQTSGGSVFSNIKLMNCPHQCVSISSASDTQLIGWTVDVSAGDKNSLGKNTDGFDLSGSSRITIRDSVVKNQDDCVAVNQGSNYIFHNLTCSGGHGLSLSVGQSTASGSVNTVNNVTFSDCTVQNSRNGIHVKTHTDAGTGSITLVNYQNIILSGITDYGINVQEDYSGGKSTGKAVGNIPIKQLNLQGVTGSMSGGSSGIGVYILCGTNGCSNWTWSSISISNAKKSNNCNFTPSGYTC